jgi:hydroxylamine dehydrogenase
MTQGPVIGLPKSPWDGTMTIFMKNTLFICLLLSLSLAAGLCLAAENTPPVSEATQTCLDCHATATPGIVAGWKKSHMAQHTPEEASKEPELKRVVTAKLADIPKELRQVVVGCAECHTMRAKDHPGSFDHEGYQVHTVVSPADCATCHTQEAKQFSQNLMAHARGNLVGNPVYMDLANRVNGVQKAAGGKVTYEKPTTGDEAESCLFCHGTEVKVDGTMTVNNPELGEVTVAKLTGWPNRGVGRKNPDGSLGSCTACHTRHQFSVKMARSPAACAECHKGPDVPGYKVYQVSKHGNIYQAMSKDWNMEAIPWTLGKDFTAPTCATCHISLLVDEDGTVLAKRTHMMTDRLWWRLLGLIYSHPQPKDPDTTKIKSADGLTLATSLDGKPASKYLIDAKEQAKRKATMGKVCLGCHSIQWVDGQFKRLDASIKSSDAMVLASTQIMQDVWSKGLAVGPGKGSPFDEYIEQVWIEQWLFFGNSVRYASAMAGADLGVFENGRWNMSKNVQQMHDWLKARQGKGQ